MQPLVLTLKLDADSFVRLQSLRQAHFPAARNYLAAHLTLFHALPGEEEKPVCELLAERCSQTAEMALHFPDLFSLGRGVAVRVVSAALEAVRHDLQRQFLPHLTAQDRQRMRPHVTIQNKVPPDEARALLETLGANWRGFEGRGVGVSLWRYEGGPWTLLHEWPFAAIASRPFPTEKVRH